MFLQIHTLTSYPASLLNRDDAGLAKRIPFGDATRLRVSSQCLKRHWREAMQRHLDLPQATRSREFFSRIVFPRLVQEHRVPEEQARDLTAHLVKKLISGGIDKNDPLSMNQPALFGKPEADYFVALLAECAASSDEKQARACLDERLKAGKKNFKAMLKAAGYGNLYSGFEGAMFGRFVTSDILARTDAAVHVAHAFTVHPIDTEMDYFTVVDDLNRDEETGAAHAGDMELGAGLYYGYVVVDVPLLVSNFTGCDARDWQNQDHADVRRALEALIEAITTVSPGAKLGSTAPYARAELVLFEAGNGQPRTLANAYLRAVQTRTGDDPMRQAIAALGDYLQSLDAMYGNDGMLRALATMHDTGALDLKRQPLPDATQAILDAVFRSAEG